MQPFDDLPLGRRGFLLAAAPAVALGAGLYDPAQASAQPWRPDLDNAQDNVEAYIKMTSSLDADDTVFGWFSGHVFSLVDNQPMLPLMGIEGFGVGGASRNSDGSYSTHWKEVGYYTDLKTGAVLERWDNPLNGERTEVMHIYVPSISSTITASFKTQALRPRLKDVAIQHPNYRHLGEPDDPFILPWFQAGDTISLWMDGSAVVPNPLTPVEWPRESSGPTMRIAEQTMYTAKSADFFNASRRRVDSVGAWNRISPWLPFMLMGQAPGGLMIRATTRSFRGYAELPRWLTDYTAKHFPELMNPRPNPALKNESSAERFKRERRPMPVKS